MYRGDNLRMEYPRLGNVRSILSDVNVMPLTATATNTLRKEICDALGMRDPTIISVSSDKPFMFRLSQSLTSVLDQLQSNCTQTRLILDDV